MIRHTPFSGNGSPKAASPMRPKRRAACEIEVLPAFRPSAQMAGAHSSSWRCVAHFTDGSSARRDAAGVLFQLRPSRWPTFRPRPGHRPATAAKRPSSSAISSTSNRASDVRQRHSWLCHGPIRRPPITSTSCRTPSCSSFSICPPAWPATTSFCGVCIWMCIGQLPTIEETKAFLADSRRDKRAKLIDKLLDRPEHAKFWALKWGDLLRLTSSRSATAACSNTTAGSSGRSKRNMPYDQFARELLSASGSTLDHPTANFYRTSTDTQDTVESISQLFLGARAAVCQVPQSSVRALDAGQLFWPGCVLQSRAAKEIAARR